MWEKDENIRQDVIQNWMSVTLSRGTESGSCNERFNGSFDKKEDNKIAQRSLAACGDLKISL